MQTELTLQLFAKAPAAGTVKTRLIPSLGAERAALLHARMVEHAAHSVAAACAAIGRARGELWCSPDLGSNFLRALAQRHRLTLRQQSAGDLGMRMRAALQSAMPGRVLLLGSDCPVLDPAALVDADRALRTHDAVFVPVEDGGYALVGFRDTVPDCFSGVEWSTGQVMAQTRTRLRAAGTRWKELPTAWDVDTAADVQRLQADVRFAHMLSGWEPIPPAEGPQPMVQPL